MLSAMIIFTKNIYNNVCLKDNEKNTYLFSSTFSASCSFVSFSYEISFHKFH